MGRKVGGPGQAVRAWGGKRQEKAATRWSHKFMEVYTKMSQSCYTLNLKIKINEMQKEKVLLRAYLPTEETTVNILDTSF